MKFKARTLTQLADMICGNFPASESVFPYRSSYYLTRFFQDADTEYEHDGSTRAVWVQSVLEEILEKEPRSDARNPPDAFLRVIRTLMDRGDALNEALDRSKAMDMLNAALAREGFEAFYAEDRECYLRHTGGNRSVLQQVTPHRPFSAAEQMKRNQLEAFLGRCSEDQLIEEVLLPLLRQLGFQRISVAGHKDKALEYGKDLWMRYVLPTQHVLYFGIQAKKGKLDAAGRSSENVAEILNQTNMMLGHEIFDPEVGRRVLVDHAYIVAGGEITKAARNWLGGRLDAIKRSQIMFIDKDDILNLFVASNSALPKGAEAPINETPDEIPF
ncbi:MAG: hypothetical protein KDK08_17520 [Rhizobiaceae bacterium]|nr:hypothetical protein [Rhizobiaceae bacterium]